MFVNTLAFYGARWQLFAGCRSSVDCPTARLLVLESIYHIGHD
jgi:hypothetical protein